MRKIILFLLILLLLTGGCQLAGQKKTDSMVIGALFSFTNPWENATSYEKIYAKKVSDPTGTDPDYRFEFDIPRGSLQIVYRELDPDDPMEDTLMSMGVESDLALHRLDDQPILYTSQATHYYATNITQQNIYLFKVYQDNQGRVFIDPSPPYYSIPISGGGFRETNAMSAGQRMIENQLQLQANFTAIDSPDQLTISQFDDSDHLIERHTYPVDQPPADIALLADAEYLLLSYETSDGRVLKKDLLAADEPVLRWPTLHDSGFIEMSAIPLTRSGQ